MKLHLVSDLHLDFMPADLPGGEVLLIAGDLAEARHIARDYDSKYTPPYAPLEGFYRYRDFLEVECAKYSRVFYVMGNHEHYGGRFDKTYAMLKNILPENVTILENELVEHNGYVFMGATLWTDLNKSDPITAMSVKDYMNDYRIVTNFYASKGIYAKLTPEFTAYTHRKTVEYFAEQLKQTADKQFIVVTHHAPSYMSIHERYKDQYHVNGGYASDLSNFILDNPNIKIWVHGHMHTPFDYKIGETRVLCNPRGYPNERRDFKVLEFEV